MERRRRLGRLTTRVVIVLAVLGAAAGVLILTRTSSPKTRPVYVSGTPSEDPATLPGILSGPAPWPANTDQLRARLSALGLPALSAEGTTLHIHQHLDLYVNGTKQVVPAQIGILTSPQVVFSPLHTHDTSGIIHVESTTVRSFTLGEFFDVWGVRFTPTCVGGYCNQATRPCGCTLTASWRRGTRHGSSCSPTRRSSSRTGRRPSSRTPSRRATRSHRVCDHDVVRDTGRVGMDADRLKAIPLFQGLSRHQREQVSTWAEEVDLEPGRHLVEQGEFAHEFL